MKQRTYSPQERANFVAQMISFQEKENISNKDLAQALDVSDNYICQIRKGKQNASPRIIKGVSDLSGIKVADLIRDPQEIAQAERAKYGRKLRKARLARGMSLLQVAQYLGTTKLVYAEMEDGKCSTCDDFKKQLEKLFFAEPVVTKLEPAKASEAKPASPAEPKLAPKAEPKAEDTATDIPLEVIDVVIKHVKDLNVSEDIQRKVYRAFSEYQLAKREEALFGRKEG